MSATRELVQTNGVTDTHFQKLYVSIRETHALEAAPADREGQT